MAVNFMKNLYRNNNNPMKRENEHQSLDSDSNAILAYFGMYFSRLYLGVWEIDVRHLVVTAKNHDGRFVGSELKKAFLY